MFSNAYECFHQIYKDNLLQSIKLINLFRKKSKLSKTGMGEERLYPRKFSRTVFHHSYRDPVWQPEF